MPHRIAGRIAQEMSFFAYPISMVMTIDAAEITQAITAITGIIVAFFAIRFYMAETKKATWNANWLK